MTPPPQGIITIIEPYLLGYKEYLQYNILRN